MRLKLVLLRNKPGMFEEYVIRYKEVTGNRGTYFDNRNVAKRAISAFHFFNALRCKALTQIIVVNDVDSQQSGLHT